MTRTLGVVVVAGLSVSTSVAGQVATTRDTARSDTSRVSVIRLLVPGSADGHLVEGLQPGDRVRYSVEPPMTWFMPKRQGPRGLELHSIQRWREGTVARLAPDTLITGDRGRTETIRPVLLDSINLLFVARGRERRNPALPLAIGISAGIIISMATTSSGTRSIIDLVSRGALVGAAGGAVLTLSLPRHRHWVELRLPAVSGTRER